MSHNRDDTQGYTYRLLTINESKFLHHTTIKTNSVCVDSQTPAKLMIMFIFEISTGMLVFKASGELSLNETQHIAQNYKNTNIDVRV